MTKEEKMREAAEKCLGRYVLESDFSAFKKGWQEAMASMQKVEDARPPNHHACAQQMQLEGKSYSRTCASCGLGPCNRKDKS